jgi:hypothetical protein
MRVVYKPLFDYLKETIRGVFKKHPEPRKIVIIGPKDTPAIQRGHRDAIYDARWKTNYGGYGQQ